MKNDLIQAAQEYIYSRRDLSTMAEMIPEHSRILDLGCGTGRLLKALQVLKDARVMGVEMNEEKVIECIGRGVPVIQANLDDGLSDFKDDSYDYVILSQTFQTVKRPDVILDEMLRIGKRGIVSFINIGYWRARIQIAFGNMPVTRTLPMQWYNTTNIHLGTISDFRNLCKERNIRIVHEIPLQERNRIPLRCRLWPNLFASTCVFIIEK